MVTFEPGAGPRQVTFQCAAVLCLGAVWKGRGSMSKGGPLECGVPEFGGRALGGGVGVGLGLCSAGGRL